MVDFIKEHPALVAAVFSSMAAIISWVLIKAHSLAAQRIDSIEAKVKGVEEQMHAIEKNYIHKFDELGAKFGQEIGQMKIEILERLHDLELSLSKTKNVHKPTKLQRKEKDL